MTMTRNTTFLDKLNLEGHCPGFSLWEVKASDGETYLMAADYEGGLSTRLFFKTNDQVSVVSATLLGPNPDVTSWDAAHK